MTEREQQLLKVAKQIVELNKGRGLDLMLTGSLMLKLRGYNLRREATDIDFLITEDCIAEEYNDWCPIMPNNFSMDYEGKRRSCPDSISFYNKEIDIKVDFIPAYEKEEIVDGIPCATIDGCLDAKLDYSIKDKQEESRKKHQEDLDFFEINNENK